MNLNHLIKKNHKIVIEYIYESTPKSQKDH